jgi:hypothetical protein
MPDWSAVGSSGVERCWQIMNRLHIASRVEAIEYLRAAENCLRHLSIGEIRWLVGRFPVMPAGQSAALNRARAGPGHEAAARAGARRRR